MPPRLLIGFGALAFACQAGEAWPQPRSTNAGAPATLASAHAARVAANPAGLSLQVRTRTGRDTFARGEVITLDLEFQETSGGTYDFDPITYDRSGRLGIDRVVVTPATGIEDPLADYYGALGFGFIGGGVSGVPEPLTAPRVLSLDVNEWVRFAQAGTYLLHVESHRFIERGAAATGRRTAAPVVSNQLVLTITPPEREQVPVASLSAHRLRHADSPLAARELARRFLARQAPSTVFGTDGYHIHFGLLGTPHRAEALAALRAGLATIAHATNESVPRVAAFLDVMVALPRHRQASDPDEREPASRVHERMELFQCRVAFWQRQALAAGLRGGAADVARASATFAQDAPAHCPP